MVKGTGGEMDVYAKRRSALGRALCRLFTGPTGRTSTMVLWLTSLSPPVVYLVLRGPSAVIKFVGQHLVRRNNKKHHFAVVPRPNGQKTCTVHMGLISITVYSPNKNAAANLCHASDLTNVL